VTGPALSRLTTALVVGVGGMAAGHLLNPLGAAGVRPAALAAFAAIVAALGAWRGWADVRARAAWDDRPAAAARGARAAAAGAAAALLAAAAAYTVVHGTGPAGP
jgi:cell division protein FtsX